MMFRRRTGCPLQAPFPTLFKNHFFLMIPTVSPNNAPLGLALLSSLGVEQSSCLVVSVPQCGASSVSIGPSVLCYCSLCWRFGLAWPSLPSALCWLAFLCMLKCILRRTYTSKVAGEEPALPLNIRSAQWAWMAPRRFNSGETRRSGNGER